MTIHCAITIAKLAEYLNLGNEMELVSVAMIPDESRMVRLVIEDLAQPHTRDGQIIERVPLEQIQDGKVAS